MRALGLRGRLTFFVLLAAVLALAGLVAGFNVLLRDSLSADADRVLEARSSAALEAVTVESGKLEVGETPDGNGPDVQVWIYRGSQSIERAPGPPELQKLADSLAGGPRRFIDQEQTDNRLLAVPVTDGGREGTVVAAISTEPYEATANEALVGSMIFAGVLLGLIAIGTRILVGRALKPVAEMTAEARQWSEIDLDHRFNAGDPRDELTSLAATFDSMLARLAAALRNERRFTAEVSHELRTPLAAVIGESEVALRHDRTPDDYRDAIDSIHRRAVQLQSTLDSLLLAATSRTESGDRSNAREAVAGALQGLSGLAEENAVEVELTGDDAAEVAASAAAVERTISPLIENAFRYAESEVTVDVARNGPAVTITVRDDGPGVDPSEAEAVFEPGRRGKDVPAGANGGAGLGLALARRLARALGGDVVAVTNGTGGRFVLKIPAT